MQKHQSVIKNPEAEVNHKAMLVSVFLFTLLMPVSVSFFGRTRRADIHWAIPLIATILFVIGLYMIFQVASTHLVTIYLRHLASVFTGKDLFRTAMGVACPLLAKALFERIATPNILSAGDAVCLTSCLPRSHLRQF